MSKNISVCPICYVMTVGSEGFNEVFIEWNNSRKSFFVRLSTLCSYCSPILYKKQSELSYSSDDYKGKILKELPVFIAQGSYCVCGKTLFLADYIISLKEDNLEFEATYICKECNAGMRSVFNLIKDILLRQWDTFNKVILFPSRVKFEREATMGSKYKALELFVQEKKGEQYNKDIIVEMIKTMAEKENAKTENTFNIYGSSGSVANQGHIASSGNQNTIGNAAGNVEGDQKTIQHNYASEQRQTLAEAAVEIQKLLKQLEETYPTATEAEKVAFVNDQTSPSFKRRVGSALKALGEAAIDEFVLENKSLKVMKATIKGWMKPE